MVSVVKYFMVGFLTYMLICGLFTLRINGSDISVGFNYMKISDRIVTDVTSLIDFTTEKMEI